VVPERDGQGRFVVEQRDLNTITFFCWTIQFDAFPESRKSLLDTVSTATR
jgi:hypothetical protein